MSDAAATCGQLVTPEDDCCGPQKPCGAAADWVHRGSGAMLCDLHEQNARRYAAAGTWAVGLITVSYPDGWEPIVPAAPAGPPTLEVVRFDA